jgi:hypothetical protein
VWSGAQDADGNGLALRSPDAGASWETFLLDGCRAKPAALLARADGAWIGCGERVWSLEEAGPRALSLPTEGTTGLVAIDRDGDALLLAGEGGVWRYLPGSSERLVDGRIRAFAPVPGVSDDASVRYLLATDDGLAAWDGAGAPVSLGWPSDDLVESVTVSQDGNWAVGTRRGAFVSADGGRTWIVATDVDRHDDRDRTFWYGQGWTDVDAAGAKTGHAARGDVGAVAEWQLEATALALRARGPGELRIVLDDVAAQEVVLSDTTWRTAWSAPLAAGLHTLRIEVVSGSILLDGGQRWRSQGAVPTPPDVDPPPPDPRPVADTEEGCGCGTASPPRSVAPFVLALAAIGLRRAGAHVHRRIGGAPVRATRYDR